MRKFSIHRNYYGECDIYERDEIEIKPGVTVLVGCNGAGKTTLITQMMESLKERKIMAIMYDNLQDGGDRALSAAGYNEDFKLMAKLMQSSEGENIVNNVGEFAGRLGKMIRQQPDDSEIWIFFDAVDSGMSIDNIVDVKNFFNLVLKEKGKTVYIVASANEYELARGEQCFDVHSGEYVTFSDYEDFRSFILKSREIKKERKYIPIGRRKRNE